jgi:Capsule assembly protein Wzi
MVRMPRRAVSRHWIVLAALLASPCHQAAADAGWFESGDTRLRMDLQLLNDAEVIVLPMNQWPLPRAAVQYALTNAKQHVVTNSAVAAALERVGARAAPSTKGRLAFDTGISGGEPGLWRDFDTLAREDGEVGAGLSYDDGRFSVGLDVTAVTDPEDGDELRADGSHVSVQWGNWLISANKLDRWWGPGHESSLILSNNARPMPTLMVERAEARPFGPDWARWLGPYRFSFGISQMESNRADIDAPLFMAWRVELMPFNKIELGISRTAQFCGEELECNLNVFGNLLAGNDNVGIDATPENEPGNQMAGFDIRWNSPIGNLPYAIYGQYIGEDESSYMPAKYLKQLGAETWKPLADGGLVQVFAEYASTTCSANTGRGPYYNCAYNQGRFNTEGYRYRGRVIGYTADNDAETYSLGAMYAAANGDVWSATLRNSALNHDGFDESLNPGGFDARNTVSAVPAKYNALEVGWRGKLFGEAIAIELGVESTEPEGLEQDVEPYGFIGWRHEFGL